VKCEESEEMGDIDGEAGNDEYMEAAWGGMDDDGGYVAYCAFGIIPDGGEPPR